MASRQTPNSRPASKPADLLKSLKSTQKKPTVLEQAAKDWDKCKQAENIEDELKQATKSRGSFLERQQFLQRADLRQFEKEREIRDKTRAKLATQDVEGIKHRLTELKRHVGMFDRCGTIIASTIKTIMQDNKNNNKNFSNNISS